jgi:endoglucanase
MWVSHRPGPRGRGPGARPAGLWPRAARGDGNPEGGVRAENPLESEPVTRLTILSYAALALASLLSCDEGAGGKTQEECLAINRWACHGVCTDPYTDPGNCGGCDIVCTGGTFCSNASCQAGCAAGQTPCGQSCVDLLTDGSNCGACGNPCPSGSTCVTGLCQSSGCPVGQIPCGQACVDTIIDPYNCGSCGAVCPVGNACVSGLCQLPLGTGGTGPTGGTCGPIQGGVWRATVSSVVDAAKLQTEYNRWKSGLYRDCGDGTACVADGDQCVSEGIGYGMLLTVAAQDRTAFDALWNFYKARRNGNGVMNWKYQACTQTVWGQNGATDAELDAAMALVIADRTWGGYTADATALITAIRTAEVDTCSNGVMVLRPGDNWGGCRGDGTLNPSYFSPGYYRVFACYVPSQAADWNKLVADTYTLLAQYHSTSGGLMCDWANFGSGCTTATFGWEAVRSPWRIATDYAWSADPTAAQILTGMSQYVDGHGGIAGLAFDPNSAFRGSLALSGMVRDQATFNTYVNAWYAAASGDNRYFQMTLRALYTFLAGGVFPNGV